MKKFFLLFVINILSISIYQLSAQSGIFKKSTDIESVSISETIKEIQLQKVQKINGITEKPIGNLANSLLPDTTILDVTLEPGAIENFTERIGGCFAFTFDIDVDLPDFIDFDNEGVETSFFGTSASFSLEAAPSAPTGNYQGSLYYELYTDLFGNNLCGKETILLNITITSNDSPTENSDQIFTDFPWLTTLVNPSNCTNETISVYNSGIYQFVFVEDNAGGKLYFQNGALYCTNASNFDCVAAYNLTDLAARWTCGDGGGGSTPPSNAAIFENYPWLDAYINENACTSESVTVYRTGVHRFLLVETPNSSNLYYQDGTFYCQQTATYNCVLAYNLMEVEETWSCGSNGRSHPPIANILPDNNTNSANINQENTNLVVFPNPTDGQVFVKLPKSKDFNWTNQKLVVMDVSGRILFERNVSNTNSDSIEEFDLSTLNSGLYFIQWQTEKERKTERLILK